MAPDANIEVDDLTLFLRVKASEAVAFKTLFVRYYEKLRQFVILTHHDPVLAEEVVQEVFTRIWERRHTLQIQLSVKYYLYTACRNQAYNLVSHKSRHHQQITEALEAVLAERSTPETILSFETLYEDLQEAMKSLPAKAREVFVLKYLMQTKHKEIAQSMNISESMVEKHAANAIRQLRKKLTPYALPVVFALLTELPGLILLLLVAYSEKYF